MQVYDVEMHGTVSIKDKVQACSAHEAYLVAYDRITERVGYGVDVAIDGYSVEPDSFKKKGA